MKTIALIFLLLIVGKLSFGQHKSTYYERKPTYSIKRKPIYDEQRKPKSYSQRKTALNTIFFNLGGAPLVGNTKSIYIERILYHGKPRAFLRAGYGSLRGESDYNFIMPNLGVLVGNKSNLEVAVGILYTYSGDRASSYFVSGSLGYRYHKPSGGIIIRAGLGISEYAYIGIGVSF